MELITTYPAAVNSKATVTMGVLDQATTIVEVLDATVLPEAPNLLVLGTDQTAETVLMTARENNTLTIQRAVQGIAKSWPAGTQIARNFTGKDWDDMRSNVEAIATKILGLTAYDVGALSVRNRVSEIGYNETNGLYVNIDGSVLEVPFGYGRHDAVLADGSVPMSGNFTTNGSVQINNDANIGSVSLYKNSSATADYGTFLKDIGADGEVSLALITKENAIKFKPKDGISRHLFGEHNKPSGSYTGNGSATKREIAIDGIGELLVIYTGTSICFAGYSGGVAFRYEDKTVSYFNSNELSFRNGSLAIASTDINLNKNSQNYKYYQM